MSSSKGTEIKLSDSLVTRFWKYVEKGRGCWNWQGAKLKGYGILNSGNKVPVYAHRVSFAIHNPGAKLAGRVVMHLCNNPSCVRPDHLSLGSNSLNAAQAFKDGLSTVPVLVGESNPRARLTWAQVQDIRTRYAAGSETYQSLGEEYGVSKVAIAYIIKGRTWRQKSGTFRRSTTT